MPAWVKHPAFFFVALMAYYPGITFYSWLYNWETPFYLSWWGCIGAAAIAVSVLLMIMAAKKGEEVLPNNRTMWTLLGLSIAYDLSANLFVFHTLWQLPLSVFMTFGTICLLWALLKRWTFLIWCPFLTLQLFQVLAYKEYGISMNSLAIAETLEASQEEVFTYLTWGNFLILCGLLLIAVLYAWLQIPLLRSVSRKTMLQVGLLMSGGSLFLGALIPLHQQSEDYYWPSTAAYTLTDAFMEAITINQDTINQVESLNSPADEPSSISTLKGDEGVVLVFHIGESVRADRMSLNGYERDTTPWLCQQQNLINFPTCISAVYDTSMAQIVIMTNGRRYIKDKTPDMQPTTGSVLDLFNANGFNVYSFFGQRCGQKLKYDRVVRVLTACSKQRFNAPGDPWTAVPQMKEVLQQHPKENLVLFINNEGSHTPFSHFDHENAPFTPAASDFENPAAQAEEINNAYDNTVHYTDEFFRRVVEELQGRPFIYFYISDHGEFLGHDGLWGRGPLGEKPISFYFSTTGCKVGAFMLYSPEFAALHPHFAEALARINDNRNMPIGDEHVFHTLLGLFGIDSPFRLPQLDMSSEQFEPYSGEMPQEKEEQHK